MKILEYFAVAIVVFGTLLSVPNALADQPTEAAAATVQMSTLAE